MNPLRLIREDGSALISAMLIMSLMVILGFAVIGMVDGQQTDSRRERERESSFQLSEGALNAQIFQLSTRWPMNTSAGSATAYPASCTETSPGQQDCPSVTALTASFANKDQASGNARWVTKVRDNGGANADYYSDAVLSEPSYDRNDDGYLWVRSTAVVRNHRRTLVALVKAEQTTLNFPRHTIVAGHFETTNTGNKIIISNDGLGQYTPSEVIVRCSFADGAAPEIGCADYDDGKGQISPNRVQSDPSLPNALSPEALDMLRASARSDGNYYTGCPATLAGNVPGEVVFSENAGASCSYPGGTWNSHAVPGVVVIAQGTLGFTGGVFYGLIYHANTDNSTGNCVDLGGDVTIEGSIVIDGNCGLFAGSNKENVIWNPNIFDNLKAFGTVGVVQNTFREISASS
jgi:hypothetical protein